MISRFLKDIFGEGISTPESYSENDQALLKEYIKSLPKKDQAILALKVRGKSMSEISKLTGYTIVHIVEYYDTILKRLRQPSRAKIIKPLLNNRVNNGKD
jgi:DNA-directed RNA polymerase specialized sigma subunit